MFGWYMARFAVFLEHRRRVTSWLVFLLSSREKNSQPRITLPNTPLDCGCLSTTNRYFRVISDLAMFVMKKDVSHNEIES